MRGITVVLLVSIIGFSSFISTVQENAVTQTNTFNRSLIPPMTSIKTDTGTIVSDGVISPNEYKYNSSLGSSVYLYYTIDRGVIYFGLSGRTRGWVSIGWGASGERMRNGDFIMGYCNDTDGTAHIQDSWGPPTVDIVAADGIDNIMSSACTQVVINSNTYTYLEFSRLLDTGDTSFDKPIIPGNSMRLLYAYYSRDDLSHIHSHEGSRDSFRFYGPPSAPRSLGSTVAKSEVDLTWTAPQGDGGSSLLHYNVYRSTDNIAFTQIDTSTSTSYTDNSVINGVNYYYKVSVINANGESGDSNTVSAIPMGDVTPPTSVSATANGIYGLVAVNWSYPVDDGGIPVSEYTIYRSTLSGGPYTQVGSNTSALGFEETVLNGFTYYYVVIAQNQYRSSQFSSEVNVNPIGVPSPPTSILTSLAGDNVSITFTTPTTNGGSTILGYRIYRSQTQNGPYSLISDGLNLSYLDTNVVNNETYYYVLTSYNSYGESAYSIEQRITVALVPDAPSNVNVIDVTPTNITISWEVPDAKGSYISYYTVYKQNPTTGDIELITTLTDTTYTDTNIIYGFPQTYIITATSPIGESSYSIALTYIPSSLPTEPLNLVSVGDDMSIKLNWDKPNSSGGIFLNYYNIYWSLDNITFDLLNFSYNREFISDNLTNGVNYYYYVTAVNALGESAHSSIASSVPDSVAAAPQLLVTLILNGVTLTWNDPTQLVNNQISSGDFRIYRSTITGGPYILVNEGVFTSYSDKSMELGILYYYVVTKRNGVGESPFSNEVNIIPAGAPDAPQNLVGFAGDRQASLIWDPPISENGRPITQFNVLRSVSPDQGFELVSHINQYYFTDTGLDNNVTYYYVVSAENSLWEGNRSNIASVTPQNAEIPTDFSYSGSNTGNGSILYEETINPIIISTTVLAVIGGGVGMVAINVYRKRDR